MEKIYMNENQKKNDNKEPRSTYHISIVLSFVVAIFGIITLVRFGFGQVSYATGDSAGVASTSFYVNPYSANDGPAWVMSNEAINGQGVEIKAEGTSAGYFNDISSFKPLFCVSASNVNADVVKPYTDNTIMSGEEANAISYILGQSAIISDSNKGIVPRGTGGENYRFLEYYATQMAIWIYKNDQTVMGTEFFKTVAGTAEQPITGYRIYTTSKIIPIYDQSIYSYIETVVNNAKVHANDAKFSISFGSEDVSPVDGTNYYQTAALVPSTDGVNSYKITSIEGVEGAIVVDENGKTVELNTSLSPSAKVYIRFPKDQMGDGKKSLTVNASGNMDRVLYKYTLQNAQDVVKVVPDDYNASTSLALVGAPDTGMNTSKTIYFIGLIVLLCGVGIIYANSKPLKDM